MAFAGEVTPLKATGNGSTPPGARNNGVAVHAEGGEYKFKFSWRKLAQFMGPGWVMSLAYLDPGGFLPPEPQIQQTPLSPTLLLDS